MIGNFIKQMWLPLLGVVISVVLWTATIRHLQGDPLPVLKDNAEFILQSLQVVFWLLTAWSVNRLLGVVIWDGIARRWFGGSVPRLLRDVTTLLVLVFAITAIVAFVFQRSVAGIWATSGAVGILLGIALKDVILDVFTGLAMNADRPFTIGDWVRIHENGQDGAIGQVVQISWRTTRLRTEENMLVVIPNNRFGNLMITNYSAPTQPTRFEIVIDIEYWIPVERVRRVMLAGLTEVTALDGFVTVPPPNVLFYQTNNCGFSYRLQYWITPWLPLPPNRAKDVVHRTVIKHLQRAGIPIAFPKQEVALKRLASETETDPLADRRRLLAFVPLFQDLPKTEVQYLIEQMRQRPFRQSETVIQKGDSGDSMFVVWEGLLSVFVDAKDNGALLRVAQIGPGEFFGEISLLTGEARSATIKSDCEGCLFEITKDTMTELFRRQPRLLDSVSRIVAERRVENDRAQNTAAEIDKLRQTESLARQFKDRIRNFFRGILN